MTRGNQALVVTSIGVAMSALDTTIVNVARDTIADDFTASDSAVSWVLSGYSIVFAAVLLASGRLADRYGRKRVYSTGLLVFVGSSAACGFAPVLEVLIAARGVQAVGAALIAPAALSLVLPEFPVERRAGAIAVWGAIGSLAAGIGPTLGSILVELWGWRSAFFINLPIGITGYVLGQRVLHEAWDEKAQGVPDVAGIAAGVGAVGLLALAITQGNDWGYLGPAALACYAATVVLVPVFVWRCSVARLPVLDLALLRRREFTAASSAAVLFSVPFYGALVASVTFLQRQWGYSVLRTGLANSLPPVLAVFIARPMGRLCDRIGHRRVLVPGAIVLATAQALLALQVSEEPAFWLHYAPSLALLGIGLGILIPGLQSATLKYLDQDRMAMGSAFYTTVRQLGAALGVAVTIALVARPGHAPMTNFRTAWTVHAGVALAVGAIVLLAYRPPTLLREPTADAHA